MMSKLSIRHGYQKVGKSSNFPDEHLIKQKQLSGRMSDIEIRQQCNSYQYVSTHVYDQPWSGDKLKDDSRLVLLMSRNANMHVLPIIASVAFECYWLFSFTGFKNILTSMVPEPAISKCLQTDSDSLPKQIQRTDFCDEQDGCFHWWSSKNTMCTAWWEFTLGYNQWETNQSINLLTSH